MKTIIAIILSATIIFADGLYDDLYSVNMNNNQIESELNNHLLYGDFEQILRFQPIFFHPSTNEILEDSNEYLNEIAKVYEKYKDKDIVITIIGYTDHVQSKTEKTNQSKWYRTYTNDLTMESSQDISLGYARFTNEQLVHKGIPKELIIVEQRGGQDNLYTRAVEEGRNKNYRAMVTMYISKDKNSDNDNDGVIDSKDKCLYTPAGHPVNDNGCSELLNLTIHYDVNSSDIQEISFQKLTNVIAFMKKYPNFKALLYGHTSIEGTKLSNQILSEKRALSIRKYLINQGISSSRISVYGRAAAEPLYPNDTINGREKNRRVEIKLQ